MNTNEHDTSSGSDPGDVYRSVGTAVERRTASGDYTVFARGVDDNTASYMAAALNASAADGRAATVRAAKIPHPSGDDGHDDAGWTPPTRAEIADLLGEGIHTGLRKVANGNAATRAYQGIEAMPDDQWAAVLDFALHGLSTGGFYIGRDPAAVCGDWPGVCNCNDPLLHNGRG